MIKLKKTTKSTFSILKGFISIIDSWFTYISDISVLFTLWKIKKTILNIILFLYLRKDPLSIIKWLQYFIARSGLAPSVLDDVRSRLMTPPLLSTEMMENMSESHSMASLMSYTLGMKKNKFDVIKCLNL